MDLRILLFILALGTSWCCNARVVTTNFSPVQNEIASALQQINQQQQEIEGFLSAAFQQINNQRQESKVDVVEEFEANKQICALCKTIAEPVLKFLKDTSNQKKITSILTKICSLTLNLKDKCNFAVSYYLPLVFLQVQTFTPQTFCITITLCDLLPISQHLSESSFESCHDLVAEVLLKLKDPDAQLETTKVLLKACDALEDFEGFAQKCKTLVSSYTPLILGNIELFLESYDVCSSPLQAWSSATDAIADVESAS